MIRIAIADDHTLLRNSLSLFVGKCAGMKVVLEAANGPELLEGLPGKKADVVLLDIRMPGMDGLKVLDHVRMNFPRIKVIMISQYDDAGLIRQAFSMGASAYLLKNTSTDELQAAILRVKERGIYHTSLTRNLVEAQPQNPIQPLQPGLLEPLTPRELDVLKLICNGLNIKEISCRLNIGTRTVETHKQSIYRKTGTESLMELLRIAIRSGLISDIDLL